MREGQLSPTVTIILIVLLLLSGCLGSIDGDNEGCQSHRGEPVPLISSLVTGWNEEGNLQPWTEAPSVQN